MNLDPLNLDLNELRKAGLRLNGSLEVEREVVRAVLLEKETGSPQVAQNFSYLRDDESLASAAEHISLGLPGVGRQTILDFVTKNCMPVSATPWQPEIDHLVFLSDQELAAIFGQADDGWQVFRREYPHSRGIVQFSRVGLDAKLTQAVVCFGAQYDWLMGYGEYILLTRDDRGWQAAAASHAWIS
jgi:hypothetical protein